jgi:hypothetical protein
VDPLLDYVVGDDRPFSDSTKLDDIFCDLSDGIKMEIAFKIGHGFQHVLYQWMKEVSYYQRENEILKEKLEHYGENFLPD